MSGSEDLGLVLLAGLMLGSCGGISGCAYHARSKAQREIDRISPSLTAPAALRFREPARYQGRLEANAALVSLDGRVPCVAFHTRVVAESNCDDDGCETELGLDERRGPPFLLVRGERGHVAVALERWDGLAGVRHHSVRRRPDYPGVTWRAPRRAPDAYLVTEAVLVAGEPLFVAGIAGRLWDAAVPEAGAGGPEIQAPVRELLPDPVLRRVEVFRGEQGGLIADLVSRRRWLTAGLVAAGIPTLLALALFGVAVFAWIREEYF